MMVGWALANMADGLGESPSILPAGLQVVRTNLHRNSILSRAFLARPRLLFEIPHWILLKNRLFTAVISLKSGRKINKDYQSINQSVNQPINQSNNQTRKSIELHEITPTLSTTNDSRLCCVPHNFRNLPMSSVDFATEISETQFPTPPEFLRKVLATEMLSKSAAFFPTLTGTQYKSVRLKNP